MQAERDFCPRIGLEHEERRTSGLVARQLVGKVAEARSVGNFRRSRRAAQLKKREEIGQLRRKFRDGRAIPAYSPCRACRPLYCSEIITFFPLESLPALFCLRAAYFLPQFRLI